MSLKFPDELTINGTEWTYKPFRFNVNKINAGKSEPSWKDVILSGSGLLTLINAKANGLNYVKLFGKCEQKSVLPDEFQRVEYLETDGNQYIDTGVLLNNTDEFEITFQSSKDALTTPVMGAISGGTAYTSTDNISVTYNVGSNVNAYSIYNNGAAGSPNYAWNGGDYTDKLKHTIKYTGLDTAPTIDGEAMTQITSRTLTESNASVTTWLFGRNNTETGTKAQDGLRIYDANFYSKGHFIPCRRKSDSVLGMYDTVTGTFLTNADTGDFTAGPDVTTPSPDNVMPIWCNNGEIKVNSQGQIYTDGTKETVEVTGINLANLTADNIVIGKIIDNSGSIPSAVNNFYYAPFISIKPNTSYVVYGRTITDNKISAFNRICWYDKNQHFISRASYELNRIGQAISPSNAYYARFTVAPYNSQNAITQAQILNFNWTFAEGTVEIPYEPYFNGGNATAKMLLAVGDYKDEQSVLNGAVTRNVGIKVLDGSENWNENGTIGDNTHRFSLVIDSTAYADSSLCTHIDRIIQSNATAQSNRPCMRFNVSGSYIFVYTTDNTTTLTQWTQFLSDQYAQGTPVTIIYPLATPTTETVTGQSLTIQAGTNVITATGSIDNLPLEVSYKAGVSVTITEVQNSQLSNNVEVTVS